MNIVGDIQQNIIGVYVVRHPTRGVVYVGSSTRCIYNRRSVHLFFLRSGTHTSKSLSEAWADGDDNMTIEIVELCRPEDCRDRELYWQKELKSPNHPVSGYKLTADHKLKLRNTHLEVSLRPGQLEKRAEAAARGHVGRTHYASQARNSTVADVPPSNNTSGVRGVGRNSRDQSLWYAYVTVDKKRVVVGTRFPSLEAASAARAEFLHTKG